MTLDVGQIRDPQLMLTNNECSDVYSMLYVDIFF